MSLKKILYSLCGVILLTLSCSMFLLPNEILSGGVSGLAIIFSSFININSEYIASILMIFLFILGYIFLGKEFSRESILASFGFSILLPLFSKFLPAIITDPLLACVYGGLIGGAGVGIIVRQGGSSGGMDIPALIMHKYLKIKVSNCVFITDALTVLLALFVYPVSDILVGLLCVFFTSLGIDKIMEYGTFKAKEVKIISEQYKLINNDIQTIMNRGTTLYTAKGGYKESDKVVMMCVILDNEYQTLLDIIEKYDKSAFVIVTDTNAVKGEGFTYRI